MLKQGDYIAPTGKLITGSVFDSSKARIERQLRDYDRQLYIKWNSKKRGGWGCWEVRRKPEFLSPVYQGQLNGHPLYTAEYVEQDIVHHVLDVAVLNDELLGKIKKMDTWNSKDWVTEMENKGEEWKSETARKAREELQYELKQYKREWKELATAVSQGANLGAFLKGIKG